MAYKDKLGNDIPPEAFENDPDVRNPSDTVSAGNLKDFDTETAGLLAAARKLRAPAKA